MALTVGSSVPQFVQEVTLNPGNVPASSTSVETFTITGIRLNTMYHVDALSMEAGISVLGARPTATNTLEITFFNPTVAAINPASQTFRIIGF